MVYVLFSMDNKDDELIGVFTTREKADEVKKQRNIFWFSDFSLHEIEMDKHFNAFMSNCIYYDEKCEKKDRCEMMNREKMNRQRDYLIEYELN